ncbi:ComEC/Rec2 family competence protein [Oryzifoliimicrobium ureilyticus]|uniref:ComEC/Rec2 family competence protein n=1 Tax=Oryzifoliimicrobium ureilyticus TaxID=3113724 RepID=UPI0030767E31
MSEVRDEEVTGKPIIISSNAQPISSLAATSGTWPIVRPANTQSVGPLSLRLARSILVLFEHTQLLAAQEVAHGRLFLFYPLCLICGSILWFKMPVDLPWTVILASIAFWLLIYLMVGQQRAIQRIIATAGLLFAIGIGCAAFESWRASATILDVPVTTTVTGRIEERESSGPGRWRYILSLQATEGPNLKRMPEKVSLVVRGAAEPLAIGARLKGKARLTPPAGPALPELNDFAFAAYFDGIGANGFLYGKPEVLPQEPSEELSLAAQSFRYLASVRSAIADRIRAVLPGDAGAFAASLVTDERRAISKETTDALRIAGLTHIVAISGLNMALSAGIFFVGLRYLLSLFPKIVHTYPTKKIAAVGALLTLCAYYMICGFAVSAERAFIMMAVMLIAVLVDRPSISLRNVAISAIIILVLSPSEALGPSFQMSYAATLALVASYALWTRRSSAPGITARLPFAKPLSLIGKFIGGILLSSMIDGFSTALFAAEHFHRLTAYGLPANLMAMPIISFIVMPFGTAAMMLMPFGLDGWLWPIVGFGLELVIEIAKWVSSWGGTMDIGRMPSWYFATAVLGFLIFTLTRTRLRLIGPALIGLASIYLMLAPGAPVPDLLIAEDGELVGIVQDHAIASNRAGPPDFIFAQWQHALVLEEHTKPTEVENPLPSVKEDDRNRRLSRAEASDVEANMRQALANSFEQTFICANKAWCAAKLSSGYSVITIKSPIYLGPACDTADIVVLAARVRLTSCRSGSLLFTGQSLRRTGSVELRIDDLGSPVITTAFEGKLQRPWTRQRSYDWRADRYDDQLPPINDNAE